jgi:predicted dienelactone hydrolase
MLRLAPNEADLVNQPRDVSFVITRLCTQAQQHPDSSQALIDPRRIAVAGQSDGGETAFAVAYYRRSSTAGSGRR